MPAVAEEQRPQRPAERREGAHRHQGVHRRGTVPEVGPGGAVEGQPAPDDDRGGEGEGEPLPVVELERGNHGHQDDRYGECRRHQQTLAERGESFGGRSVGRVLGAFAIPVRRPGFLARRGCRRLPVVRGFPTPRGVLALRVFPVVHGFPAPGVRGGLRRLGGRTGYGLRRVARLLDRGDEVVERGSGAEGDAGLLRRVVDRGGDTVHAVELLLDAGRAGGAGHPADRELGLGGLRGRGRGCCGARHVRTPG